MTLCGTVLQTRARTKMTSKRLLDKLLVDVQRGAAERQDCCVCLSNAATVCLQVKDRRVNHEKCMGGRQVCYDCSRLLLCRMTADPDDKKIHCPICRRELRNDSTLWMSETSTRTVYDHIQSWNANRNQLHDPCYLYSSYVPEAGEIQEL